VALSVVGYAGLVWIALAFGLAAWTRRRLVGVVALTALAVWSSDLIALGVKAATDRRRPFEVIPEPEPVLTSVVGSSFPSGHAATSFAGAVILAFLVGRVVPALLILAAAIAFSRVYVGVHYPSDVLAGAALGAAVSLALAGALRLRRRPSGGRRRSGALQPPG
jgi:undecaprenyl-diphosphatase